MTSVSTTRISILAATLLSISHGFVPSVSIQRNTMNVSTIRPQQQELYSSLTADQYRRTPVVDQSDFDTRTNELYFVTQSTKKNDNAAITSATATATVTESTIAAAVVSTEETAVAPPASAATVQATTKKPTTRKASAAVHQEGVFSPVVYVAKDVLGAERLNKLRGEIIALHSDAIKGFVATADSVIGQAVLKQLFAFADQNKDGKIDKEELRTVLKALRFEWLNDKQVNGIFERADLDHNGDIDMAEWMKEAPSTLKTNLVKLAKSNGGKMGLLV